MKGLGLRSGEAALVGDTAAELATHAIALLRDPDRCARLAEAGIERADTVFGEYTLRRALLAAVERDVCTVCGRFTKAIDPGARLPSPAAPDRPIAPWPTPR